MTAQKQQKATDPRPASRITRTAPVARHCTRRARSRRGVLAATALVAALAAEAPLHAAPSTPAATRYNAYVDGPWGQVHVRVQGRAGDPTVFLLHQMVVSSEIFRLGQLALAERGIRSIAIDIPGHGLSDGPPSLPTAGQYAEILVPVLKAFGIRSANLLGTATGAAFITAFADAHPEMVKSLILEGPTIWTQAERQRLIETEYADQVPGADGVAVPNRPNAWFAHDAVFRYDPEPAFRRFRAPVMILTYPGQALYQTALKVKERYPAFELAVLDCSTMIASLDTPEAWADRVAGFVKRQK